MQALINGDLHIRGKAPGPREISEVRRIAEAVPGVVELNLDELTSPVHA